MLSATARAPPSEPSMVWLAAIPVVDDRQRLGNSQGCAGAHDRAKGDQKTRRTRQGGADRPGRENGRADQKESLASEPIGQAAADEHQARKDHGVGVDDPLQDAGRGV